jgi:diguanylate cyclase (GGDEF)-like protein/PAS domain S-box-containing protein
MHDVSVSLYGVLDALPDAALLVDQRGVIVHANFAASELLGFQVAEVIGRPVNDFVPPRHREAHAAYVQSFHDRPRVASMGDRPLVYALAREREIPVTISLSPMKFEGEDLTLALLRDATKLHRRLDDALHRADTDGLTGLGNRTWALNQLEQRVRAKQPFALLFLDLVGFKAANDRFGHHVGDEVLRLISRRLRGAVRGEDLAARLGGDEFVALLSGMSEPLQVIQRAAGIAGELSQPLQLRAGIQSVGVSIGAALFPAHATTATQLLQCADQAMYRAKRQSLDYCLYGTLPMVLPRWEPRSPTG